MQIKLKPNICQEGGQFYHEPTGRVIAEYADVKELCLEKAKWARAQFARDFPEFVITE